jgi:methionyl-tRNA formyltransferase
MAKIIFMGCTNFSKEVLLSLLENKFTVEAIFSIPEKFRISYSKNKIKNYNYAGLNDVAKKYNIDFFEVKSSKDTANFYKTIHDISPDIILVVGWYYIVPRRIREIAKYGAWGIHASLLPSYRGGAPLVWAIINGEKKAGVTLFRLDDSVDSGDIIAQKSFPIDFEDTIGSVYLKATVSSKQIILNAIKDADNVRFLPQAYKSLVSYSQRKPEDGKINLGDPALKVYNFIRAQSKPYPGAFSSVMGKKIIFWKIKHFKHIPNAENIRVGEIFKKTDRGFIKLKDGFLEILYCKYGSREGDFYAVASKSRLWGHYLK